MRASRRLAPGVCMPRRRHARSSRIPSCPPPRLPARRWGSRPRCASTRMITSCCWGLILRRPPQTARPRVPPPRQPRKPSSASTDTPSRAVYTLYMQRHVSVGRSTQMKDLTPQQIVRELDRYIVGQTEAKRAVAIALRNRYRRLALPPEIQSEITPKNILMIGPTGVGKTEIARRLAKLAEAPFIKVEATKFTQVGYVGRDVESIIRDLMETAVNMVHEERTTQVREQAAKAAEERIVTILVQKQLTEDMPAAPTISTKAAGKVSALAPLATATSAG